MGEGIFGGCRVGYLADVAGGGILGGIWMIMKGEGIFGGCRVGIWMTLAG